MVQQQLSSLQDALNRLLRGEHKVLHDQGLLVPLPDIILRLMDNQKKPVVEKLLEQLQLASRSVDKDLRQAASSWLVAIAARLIQTRHWNILDKMVAGLKTIAGSPAYPEQLRTAAAKAAQSAQARQSVDKEAVPNQGQS